MKTTQPIVQVKIRKGEYIIQKDFVTYIARKSETCGLWNLYNDHTDEWMGAARTLKQLFNAVKYNA